MDQLKVGREVLKPEFKLALCGHPKQPILFLTILLPIFTSGGVNGLVILTYHTCTGHTGCCMGCEETIAKLGNVNQSAKLLTHVTTQPIISGHHQQASNIKKSSVTRQYKHFRVISQ